MNSKGIVVRPLKADRWPDLLKLFGKNGAYWGCWCMYWRYSNKEFNASSAKDRKIALQILTEEKPHPPGLLAYMGDIVVGWIAFSPRTSFSRLIKSRVIKQISNKPVWSIVCFFIHKKYRGNNIGSHLIKGVIDYAKKNNISIIESYPVETGGEKISIESSYVGIASVFEKAGFIKVGDTKAKSGGRPRIIMRYEIDHTDLSK